MTRNNNRPTHVVSSSLGLTTMVARLDGFDPASGKGRRGGGPSEEAADAPIRRRRPSARRAVPALVAASAAGALAIWLGMPAGSGSTGITSLLGIVAAN